MMKLNGSLIKILKSKLFYFEMPLKIQNPSYVFFLLSAKHYVFNVFYFYCTHAFLDCICVWFFIIMLKVFVIQTWMKVNHFNFNIQDKQVYEHA